MNRKAVLAALCGAMMFGAAKVGWSQENYPSKPVKLVVGFPPGGGADSIARLYAEKVSRELGQQVIVENKPGGGTTIASDQVARSAPDGYTILLATSGITGGDKVFYPSIRYEPDDFVPIIKLTDSPLILAVSKGSGVTSVGQLVEKARARPKSLNFAHSGTGVITHLAGVEFAQAASVELTEVPYRGGAQAALAVAADEADVIFATVPSILPMIDGGRVVPLAVTSLQRSSLQPNLPPVSETLQGFNATIWFGVFGPKGLPQHIQDKLFAASSAVMKDPAVVSGLEKMGEIPSPSASQAGFKEFVKEQGKASVALAKRALNQSP